MVIWFLIVLLTGVIFFCTLAGAALRSIPVERLRAIREGGGKNAARIEYWIARSQQITWSLRVASRVSCVALALAMAALITGEAFPLISILVALLITGFLVAFPGSLIPLALGQRAGEGIGVSMLPVLRLSGIVLAPLASLCECVINALLKILGRPPLYFTPISLKGELEQLVGGEKEVARLDEEERRMIRHIFEFGDTEVREIMTPRTSICCISENDTVESAMKLIREEHHSRIPIFRESPDNIIGILYARDLMIRLSDGGASGIKVGALGREALFVPETKKVDALFSKLREEKIHMAIVVDEYGCTTGLVTMEDILEEIVGEIQDEYDSDEKRKHEKVGDGVYLVDARISVSEVREEMGIDIPEGDDYDTLAGFVYSLSGRVPAAGESIDWKGCTIVVREANGRGVSRLEIRKPPLPPER